MADKILVIATGGTIVSPKKGGAAAPDAKSADSLLAKAGEYFDEAKLDVEVIRPFGEAGIDSSDIGPAQWIRLASEIYGAGEGGLRGVLITHGTDTMAYTAAWLSLCFPHEEFPIILTGSQQSPDVIPFDGEVNLLGAAKLAGEGIRGVWIYFDWKLFDGRRAHKASCEAIDAYRSVGGAPLSYHDALRGRSPLFIDEAAVSFPPGFARVLELTNEEVSACAGKAAVVFALPGSVPRLCGDEKVLIVVGYGTGNMPQSWHKELKATYCGGNKPCIIACSQAEEGEKNPRAYKNVGIGGLAEGGFAVFGQGAFTLEYITALAHYAVLASDEPGGILSAYLRRL